jgi:hypothetical protein
VTLCLTTEGEVTIDGVEDTYTDRDETNYNRASLGVIREERGASNRRSASKGREDDDRDGDDVVLVVVDNLSRPVYPREATTLLTFRTDKFL